MRQAVFRGRALGGGVWSAVLAVACVGPERVPRQDLTVVYDLVLQGGRVMDPESGLDRKLNVAVRGDRIVALSPDRLSARETIDVSGLVVAPGFIDLHAHGQNTFGATMQVQDGVTTQLELEIGVYPVAPWYAQREGRALINYGVAVGHRPARAMLMLPSINPESANATTRSPQEKSKGTAGKDYAYRAATAGEIDKLHGMLDRGLREGGLGIGFHVAYTPGATPAEIEQMFRVAAAHKVPAFIHVRSHGTEFVNEAMRAAKAALASLHVVHIASSAPHDVREALAAIAAARAKGQDVTTEVYPYTAGQTRLESPIFDDGWRERRGLDYGDIQWVATGERLTKDTFDRYRHAGGGAVLLHYIPQEAADFAVAAPGVMIASDASPYENGRGHPRSAGTFARVLGHNVRELKALGLMDAVAKMTILPARRLEGVTTQMKKKGRIAVGADADITVFDPGTVAARATYENAAIPSVGIPYVLVNGKFVVKKGQIVPGTFPGRPVRGPIAPR